MPATKTKISTGKTATKKPAAPKARVVKAKPMAAKKSVAALDAELNALPPIPREFVSCDRTDNYAYCFGNVVASSFSGFIAGIIVTSLTWIVVVNVFFIE